jgi:hypothetical protein
LWDWSAIRVGYHGRDVVDGGKRRIILTAIAPHADRRGDVAPGAAPGAVPVTTGEPGGVCLFALDLRASSG